MTHPRAEFKYALEHSGDINDAFLFDCIGEIYKLEVEILHWKNIFKYN